MIIYVVDGQLRWAGFKSRTDADEWAAQNPSTSALEVTTDADASLEIVDRS